jgi:predicted DNA-binding transcriptional regulator YafY
MNRVDRLLALILLLQSKRVITAEQIAEHFELSVRTVYRDLSALGEAGVPIAAEAGVGYSLLKGYHLPPVMFTAEEASALSTGGQLVAHLTDDSMRKHMDSALLKIRSALPATQRDYIERLERATVIVNRHNPVPNLAIETLVPIQKSIAERRVVSMEYQSGKTRELTQRQAEPLGLLYYRNAWHLIAYCRLRREFRDFRTDRIRKLRLLDERFTGHEDFSLKRYTECCKDTKSMPVAQVRFAPEAMERVRRDWSCGLLEERLGSKGISVALILYSIEYLGGWLLSFGSSAVVLSPPELQEWMATEARHIAANYSRPRPLHPLRREPALELDEPVLLAEAT